MLKSLILFSSKINICRVSYNGMNKTVPRVMHRCKLLINREFTSANVDPIKLNWHRGDDTNPSVEYLRARRITRSAL